MVNRAGGVGPEQLDGLLHGRTRADSLGSLTHLRLETMQLLPTPRIGLVQVDVAAEKFACGEAVAVAPDGVSVRCCRRIHVAQESRQPGVRLGGLAGAGVDLGAQRTLVRAAAGEGQEIGHALAGLPAPHLGLPGADQSLAACRREPEVEAMAQGCLQALDGRRHLGKANRDVVPILGAALCGEVEDLPDRLHR
jgi:hypothetical protein